MTEKEIGSFVTIMFFIGAVIGFSVNGCVFYAPSMSAMRADAVKHHCAEFVVTDSTKGDTEFKWKETP